MIIKEDHETNDRNIMMIMGDHDHLGGSNTRHSRLAALTKGIFIVLTKTSHERALQTGSPYEGNLYRFGKNIAGYA